MKKNKIKSKIGYFERKKLIKCGKKDAIKGVICFNEDTINSPFIEKELSLCIIRIQNEYEEFLKLKHDYQKSILVNQLEKSKMFLSVKNANKKLEQAKSDIETLHKKYETQPKLTGTEPELLLGEDTFNEYLSEVKEFRRIENQAPVEVERARFVKRREELFNTIDKLPFDILSYENKIEEMSSFEQKENCNLKIEYDIYVGRCKQQYSLTVARIAEYWNGVLQTKKQSNNFKFADNRLIYEKLQKDIDKFDGIAMEIKYDNTTTTI